MMPETTLKTTWKDTTMTDKPKNETETEVVKEVKINPEVKIPVVGFWTLCVAFAIALGYFKYGLGADISGWIIAATALGPITLIAAFIAVIIAIAIAVCAVGVVVFLFFIAPFMGYEKWKGNKILENQKKEAEERLRKKREELIDRR
jgi:ABC-type Na+ efflux pump permease subunit